MGVERAFFFFHNSSDKKSLETEFPFAFNIIY